MRRPECNVDHGWAPPWVNEKCERFRSFAIAEALCRLLGVPYSYDEEV